MYKFRDISKIYIRANGNQFNSSQYMYVTFTVRKTLKYLDLCLSDLLYLVELLPENLTWKPYPKMAYFYSSPTKSQEGNVFSHVYQSVILSFCHSVCPQGWGSLPFPLALDIQGPLDLFKLVHFDLIMQGPPNLLESGQLVFDRNTFLCQYSVHNLQYQEMLLLCWK